jgi:hypothetical protein
MTNSEKTKTVRHRERKDVALRWRCQKVVVIRTVSRQWAKSRMHCGPEPSKPSKLFIWQYLAHNAAKELLVREVQFPSKQEICPTLYLVLKLHTSEKTRKFNKKQ